MYYFQNREESLALSSQLPHVLALARAAEDAGRADVVRYQDALLRRAIEALLGTIGEQFLDLEDTSPGRVLAALAEDHLLDDAESAAGARRSGW
jgi:hypothetical protein